MIQVLFFQIRIVFLTAKLLSISVFKNVDLYKSQFQWFVSHNYWTLFTKVNYMNKFSRDSVHDNSRILVCTQLILIYIVLFYILLILYK